MKNSTCAAAFALVFCAAPVLAGNSDIPPSTLRALGLGAIQPMSDAEGAQVRGRLTGTGNVIGTSLISFALVTPNTMNMKIGSSIKHISGTSVFNAANQQISGSHGVAINPAVALSVAVTNAGPNNFTYVGSVVGAIGGFGIVKLGPLP